MVGERVESSVGSVWSMCSVLSNRSVSTACANRARVTELPNTSCIQRTLAGSGVITS